jgi:superoxide dismutase, Fe-Mn family
MNLRTGSAEHLKTLPETGQAHAWPDLFPEHSMKNIKPKDQPRKAHDYKAKRLAFRAPLRGISDRTLQNHHDRLYVGYVTKKNEIENRLEELGRGIVKGNAPGGNPTHSELRALKENETYAVNGVYLHEWYFEVLGGDGKHDSAPELAAALIESYGSVEGFVKYFSECAMAARGWSVLAWDTKEHRLWAYNCDAHNQGGVWGALPVIVLDVYEHAYFMDYGADRKTYIEAFWKNFNWPAANELFKKASAIRF